MVAVNATPCVGMRFETVMRLIRKQATVNDAVRLRFRDPAIILESEAVAAAQASLHAHKLPLYRPLDRSSIRQGGATGEGEAHPTAALVPGPVGHEGRLSGLQYDLALDRSITTADGNSEGTRKVD